MKTYLRRTLHAGRATSLLAAVMLTALSASGQVPAIFKNFGTLSNAAPIQATTVENFGRIFAYDINASAVLYDTQDTLNFLNGPSGIIDASPGLRFDYLRGDGSRSPSFGFTNRGVINVTTNLLVTSTNIVSRNGALLSADAGGKIKLTGSSIDLLNGRLRAGNSLLRPSFFEGSLFILNNVPVEYTAPANIIDEYWGVGTQNNVQLDAGISSGGVSAQHRVTLRTGYDFPLSGGTLSTIMDLNPPFGTTPYSFYYTSNAVLTANNVWRVMMQLVFVQTNLLDAPVTRVYFGGGTNSNNYLARDVIVEYEVSDIDIITGQTVTKYVSFIDDTPAQLQPNLNSLPGNVVLVQNLDRPGLFRPSSHMVTRSSFSSGVGFETPATTYDPTLIFTFVNPQNGRYETNRVPVRYAASQFTIAPRDLDITGFGDLSLGNRVSHNATNGGSRIEIDANQVDMTFAKIQADNLFTLKANTANLTSAEIKAQNLNINLQSTNGTMVFSNNFPGSVPRLNGTVSAWSGVWQITQFLTNTILFPNLPQYPLGTNTIEYTYHVLIVNADASNFTVPLPNHEFATSLRTNKEVEVGTFTTSAANLVLGETMTITENFLFSGESLLIPTNGTLSFTGDLTSIGVQNFPNLKYLTNQGVISVPQIASFGLDRAQPYSNIVNTGTIFGETLQFRSDLFINSSAISALGGSLVINAKTNVLGGFLQAGFNIELSGDDLVANNSFLTSFGSLNLDVSQRLDDQGVTNFWSVRSGFSLNSKPVKGDLLSTHLTSFGPTNFNVLHFWAGEDRGDNPDGYANNTAIGRLVLDGEPNSRFVFAGTGVSNAMYIDYLELLNSATNFATSLSVQPNLTIYIADSNLPVDKITNAHNGRIVWVSPTTRAGPPVVVPLSISQSVTMTTQEYRALLPGDQDYDDDGIKNSEDATPISGFTVNEIRVVNLPPLTTFISWQAIGGVSYVVEYKNGLSAANWTQLGTFQSPDSRVLTVGDPVPAVGQKYYRVRYVRPGS